LGFSSSDDRRKHTKFSCTKKKNGADAAGNLKRDSSDQFLSKKGVTNRAHNNTLSGKRTADTTADDLRRFAVGYNEAGVTCGDVWVSPLATAGGVDVRLPEDVTLKDCFVKVVRLDNSIDEGANNQDSLSEDNRSRFSAASTGGADDEDDGGFRNVQFNDERRQAVGGQKKPDTPVMCDGCGKLLPCNDALVEHERSCEVRCASPVVCPPGASYNNGRHCLSVQSDISNIAHPSPPPLMTNAPTGMQWRMITGGQQHQQQQQNNYVLENNPYDNTKFNIGVQQQQRICIPQKMMTVAPSAIQSATAAPPDSVLINQNAVMEMLQIAEHFLRQNALSAGNGGAMVVTMPPAAVTMSQECRNDIRGGGSSVLSFVDQDHVPFLPPPPPYAAAVAAFRSTAATDGSNLLPLIKSEIVPAGCGKEILYEGTKMLEYVEFQCDVCLLTFSTGSEAARHVESSDHVESSVASYHMYHCIDCNIKYRDKQVMRNHSLYLCTSVRHAAAVTVRGGVQNGRLFTCRVCFKTFITNEFLQAHTSLKHGPQSVSAAATVTRDQTTSPQQQQQQSRVSMESSSMSYAGAGITPQRYPMLSDATAITNLHASGVHLSRQPYLVPTPSVVSIPTLEQLTSGFTRVDPSLFRDLLASSSSSTCSSTATTAAAAPPSFSSCPSHQPTLFRRDSFDINIPNTPSSSSLPVDASPSVDEHMKSAHGSPTKPITIRPCKAKGIYYKNVFMQCEGTYYCSVCKQDLSNRETKKTHRLLACGDPKTVTYSRRYSYLCPYCTERFPSQKTCRQHQITECLKLIGVSMDELSVKEMTCPLCPKKYFNLIPLKGHMTQVHTTIEGRRVFVLFDVC